MCIRDSRFIVPDMTDLQPPEFSITAMQEVSRLISQYPADKQKSALLPVLHIAQKEFGGWLSSDTMDYVAPVSYTHLRAHETVLDLVCRLLLEKKKHNQLHQTLRPEHLSSCQIDNTHI